MSRGFVVFLLLLGLAVSVAIGIVTGIILTGNLLLGH